MVMQKNPRIILNQNPNDQTMKILIPPMRAFNVFEIEDNFDSVISEIQRSADAHTAQFAIRFFTKVKYAIEHEDVEPLLQYFPVKANDIIQKEFVLQMLEEFVRIARSKNRMMH